MFQYVLVNIATGSQFTAVVKFKVWLGCSVGVPNGVLANYYYY